MDRGTDTLKSVLNDSVKQIDLRQTRRGCMQECLGCEAVNEFKYFTGDRDQVAHSLADADFCGRFCCPLTYPFTTKVTDVEGSPNELITVDRPFVCCPSGPCKCCCYQEATFSSGGEKLGSAVETCYCFVPKIKVLDADDQEKYILRPPTCCGGMCVNICAEGNPCGQKGCCKSSFRFYPADQEDINGDAPYIGKVLKRPKSLMTEVFTDADSFLLDFPEGSTAAEKGILLGSSLFLNTLFYEGGGEA